MMMIRLRPFPSRPFALRPLTAMLLAAGAALSLSACVTDGYYGGGGYGYYDSYYGGYGGATPYYGWYDGFYYPGTGYYVYDRGGRRHSWNDGQRRYWEGRRASGQDRRRPRENWSGFRRDRQPDRTRYSSGRRINRNTPRAEGRQQARPQAQPGRRDNRAPPARQNRRNSSN